MALCALILAHDKVGLTSRLTRRLQQDGVACFIHIDARSDIEAFRQACLPFGARFLAERRRVFWGGFSMIEATIDLAQEALAQTDCSHFLLTSGDSYPLRGRAEIEAYLLRDFDFIDVEEFGPGDEFFGRISNTYLPDTPATSLRATVEHQQRLLDADFFVASDRARANYAMKQSHTFPWRYAKGSNWWCLRRETLARFLELGRQADYVEWFRYSANPDEAFFNTLALNHCAPSTLLPSPIFAIWDKAPRPYEFETLDDLTLLRATDKPFARKFCGQCGPLLDQIDEGGATKPIRFDWRRWFFLSRGVTAKPLRDR